MSWRGSGHDPTLDPSRRGVSHDPSLNPVFLSAVTPHRTPSRPSHIRGHHRKAVDALWNAPFKGLAAHSLGCPPPPRPSARDPLGVIGAVGDQKERSKHLPPPGPPFLGRPTPFSRVLRPFRWGAAAPQPGWVQSVRLVTKKITASSQEGQRPPRSPFFEGLAARPQGGGGNGGAVE